MLLDHIDNAQQYAALDPRIAAGLALLNDEHLRTAPLGKHEVRGADLFCIVDEYTTKPFAEGRPETHQKYLDIQYIASGAECIGYCPPDGLQIVQPYDPDKDIAFYAQPAAMSRLVLTPGMFAIFWPGEPHLPGRSLDAAAPVKKIVVKVRIA